jgi:prepilin-type N-terminal cleavage/methylation domain-containing protein
MTKNRKGFTLIELLLVVAIIAILAVVVFVALNPSKRLKDSKDSRRATDIANIMTAVHAYIVDNAGSYPAGLTVGMSEAQLGTALTGGAIVTGGCNVATAAALSLITPLTPYLKSMPIDPSGSAALTKYSIVVDANGIVTVKACGAENTTLSLSQ